MFNYRSGAHNVIEIPADNCDALSSNAAKTLASQSAPTPVRVPRTQPGVQVFACSVSDHCDEGQHVQVTTLGQGTYLVYGMYGEYGIKVRKITCVENSCDARRG